jgi:hypothetical protein
MERLALRHGKDVFVPECKDGPTYIGSHLRLDAWAMIRSWSNYRTFGYEVKVSRSDFVRDEKMQGYLPLCHEFYVVAPAGIVESLDELPAGAGLLLASPNHHRLIAKRKAQYREIADPVLVYRYILMARARIDRDTFYMQEGREIFWRSWLERKEINRELGHHVSKAIRDLVEKRIEAVEQQNQHLKRENDKYAEIKAMLLQMGEGVGFGLSPYSVRKKLEAYKKGFPQDFENALARTRRDAQDLVQMVDEVTKTLGESA